MNIDIRTIRIKFNFFILENFISICAINLILFIAPGSVGPFSLLSRKNNLVKYFFDEIAFKSFDYFAFPLQSSSKTIVLHKKDFTSIFEASSSCQHKINLIKTYEKVTEEHFLKVSINLSKSISDFPEMEVFIP